jgi:hypothetical protein
MAIARGFAATAMFAGLALGLAAPASAAPAMSGHYIGTETSPGGMLVTGDWYFTPCGDGCASVAAAAGGPAYAQARLANGQWTEDEINETTCRDGTRVPAANATHYAWDPNTLTGTAQATLKLPACGQPVGYTQTNTFQLRQAP